MEPDTLLTRVDERGLRIDSIEHAQMRRAVRARLLAEEQVPTRIDRYLVTGRLGAGGMGVVYAARDVELDRDVAVKVLLDPGERGPDAQERLLREARALAQLAHPNVVAIHDVGMHGDRVFIAMELVRGETLRVHVRERCTDWRERLRVYLQAGEGLSAAHAAGLVHRDFKPDNALVGTDGRVRVVDFGLAQSTGSRLATNTTSRSVPEHSRLTTTGNVAGTPAYMAPEQLEGGIADARADQFSFCVSLWEQLHGQHPFDGSNVAAIRRAHAAGRITAVSRGSDVPAWLRAVLARGLAIDPAARWASMTDLLRACERDPTRRRVTAMTVGTAIVLAGTWLGAAQLERSSRARACDELAPDLAAVWNEETAARVRGDFIATGLVHAATSAEKLDARLAAWRDDFSAVRGESCSAHGVDGTLADETWARRRECFDERAERFTALVDALAQPDRDTVNFSVRAAVELPDQAPCIDDARLAARAERVGSGVDEDVARDIRRRLERAMQLQTLRRLGPARVVVESARADALAIADPSLAAEAQLGWARLLVANGEYANAAAENSEAYFAAMRVRDDELALAAAIHAVRLFGVDLAQHHEGLEWSRHAVVLLERLGPGHDWDAAWLEHAVAEVHRYNGEQEAALAGYRRVIALRTSVAGPDHPSVGAAQLMLGGLLTERAEYDEADVALLDAERILASAYGDDAPALADVPRIRCSLEHLRGDYPEGMRQCQRAAKMSEAELGREHPGHAMALSNLASAYFAQGDNEKARALVTEAIAIRRTKLAPNHPDLADSLNNLGMMDSILDDLPAAQAHLEEALRIRRIATPKAHTDIANTSVNLGNVLRWRGDVVGARKLYEHAAAITTGDVPEARRIHATALHGIGESAAILEDLPAALAAFEALMTMPGGEARDPVTRCEVRHDYAHVLYAAGRDTPRVLDLIREARVACIEGGARGEDLLPELDLWLAHGKPATNAADEQHDR